MDIPDRQGKRRVRYRNPNNGKNPNKPSTPASKLLAGARAASPEKRTA